MTIIKKTSALSGVSLFPFRFFKADQSGSQPRLALSGFSPGDTGTHETRRMAHATRGFCHPVITRLPVVLRLACGSRSSSPSLWALSPQSRSVFCTDGPVKPRVRRRCPPVLNDWHATQGRDNRRTLRFSADGGMTCLFKLCQR